MKKLMVAIVSFGLLTANVHADPIADAGKAAMLSIALAYDCEPILQRAGLLTEVEHRAADRLVGVGVPQSVAAQQVTKADVTIKAQPHRIYPAAFCNTMLKQYLP